MVTRTPFKEDYYIYMYFRPNNTPCYVGKGRGNRWLVHLKRSTNPHLAAIIKKAGSFIPHVKLIERLTSREAYILERAFILVIGREVHGGPLVNLTDGGDGSRGVATPRFSKASRKLLRQYRLGKKASAETRRRQSEQAKLKGFRPPSRLGAVSEKRGVPISEKQKRKISKTLRRHNRGHGPRVISLETRMKLSAAAKRRATRPEEKAKWALYQQMGPEARRRKV